MTWVLIAILVILAFLCVSDSVSDISRRLRR